MESILKTDLERGLLEQCSAVVEPQGFRIVDLDCRVGGRSVIRIYIERLAAASGLEPASEEKDARFPGASIEDCANVSRLVGPVLEADSRIPGAFDLEVSSPGLERRLRLRADFEQLVGNEVKLKLVERLEGRGANIHGTITRVDGDQVVVSIEGTEVGIPWPKIKQANRVWNFDNHR